MATKKKTQEITIRSSAAEYLTFTSTIGDQPDIVELRYQDENLWLTQRLMAELYSVDVRTINEHIQKIYSDNELSEEATIRNFRIVQTEGNRQVTREVKHYNLQMIIAVGFKVNNERAVQFRKQNLKSTVSYKTHYTNRTSTALSSRHCLLKLRSNNTNGVRKNDGVN